MGGSRAGSLTLRHLTVRNGLALGGSSVTGTRTRGGGLGAGGAIFAAGAVSLDRVTLTND